MCRENSGKQKYPPIRGLGRIGGYFFVTRVFTMKKYPPIGPHKMGVDWNAALKTSGVAPSVTAKLVGAGQDTLGQPSTARPAGNAQNTPPSNAPLAGAGQDTLGHRRTNETRKTNTCCVACSTDKQGGTQIKQQRREHYPWILLGAEPRRPASILLTDLTPHLSGPASMF